MKKYFVYILTTKFNKMLYTGVTNDLTRRVYEHKAKQAKDGNSFTSNYSVKKLVYFEEYDNINLAIEREKQIKKWNREWKIHLIEKLNPEWNDLYESLMK